MTSPLLVAVFLLAHAAVHATFLAPRPPVTAGGPTWPFELGHSWLLGSLGVDAQAIRTVGLALIAVTIGGFALAALTAIGPLPDVLWPPAIAIGAIGSLALLAIYFNPWLTVGVAIDVALLWAVLIANWAPDGVTP